MYGFSRLFPSSYYNNRPEYLWCRFDEFSASEFEQHNDTGFEYWNFFWIVFIPVPVAILNIKGTFSSFGFWILPKFWRIRSVASCAEAHVRRLNSEWILNAAASKRGFHVTLPCFVAGTVTQNQHLALVDRRDSIHINKMSCHIS